MSALFLRALARNTAVVALLLGAQQIVWTVGR